MPETASQIGSTPHLPEQPRQAFSTLRWLSGQKRTELFGQIDHDCTRFKHPSRRRRTQVKQGGNFGVWIDFNEAATELLTFADVDGVGIILSAGMPKIE